jgi:hypothetical protein
MNKQLSLGDLRKMKLSSVKLPKGITITQIILAVVSIILLALAIYFTVSYFGAVNHRNLLNSATQLTQLQIDNIGGPQNISSLQSQLEEAQQDLIDDSPFPLEIDNVEVVYLILQAAADANVNCFQYSPSGKTSYGINGRAYTSNNFAIGSSGVGGTGEKINRIIKFLTNIEELPYNAVSITGLSLSSASDTGTWSVSFSLSILSRQ